MNRPYVQTNQPGGDSPANNPPVPLPRWEQLLLEHQHELIMTLAAILIKRLPAGHPGPGEVNRE
jgi:hypothetical protein